MHEELNIGRQYELGLDVLRQYPEVATDWDGSEYKPTDNDEGNLGEALFAAEVSAKYWRYWKPGGDGYKGDIIIAPPDEKALVRVQIKKGNWNCGGFNIRWWSGTGSKKKKYELDAFDVMAAWISLGDKNVWIYSTPLEPVTYWHPNPMTKAKGIRPEVNNWHLVEDVAREKRARNKTHTVTS
tara:strand:+ start:532 stop:1080 length:549 start_codon:yes stop_codon:yes gene_type:complete